MSLPPPAPLSAPHGFVAHDERERVLVAFAELVAERGLACASLEAAASAAGVERTVATSYFRDQRDCAVQAIEAASAQLFSAVGEAFVSTAGDCPLAARAALAELLRFMAASPCAVHLVVVEGARLGSPVERARRRSLELLAEFLGPGFAAAGGAAPRPQLLALLIAGGIYELLAQYYLEGRLEQLPEALPAVTYLTVAPFFGRDEARRVAALSA